MYADGHKQIQAISHQEYVYVESQVPANRKIRDSRTKARTDDDIVIV